MSVTKKDISESLQSLGLAGKPVCVHSSLKSFGETIEGGAQTIIDAFLELGCTLMVPTHSYMFAMSPPPELRPRRNGIDYNYYNIHAERFKAKDKDGLFIFTTNSNIVNKEYMGLLPYTLLHNEGRIRGYHPEDSFAALGDKAYELLKDQSIDDMYAPLKALCRLGGSLLLMGVGLDHATLIHYSEELAGRNFLVRWARDLAGNIVPFAGGECSSGFGNLEFAVKDMERDLLVKQSLWRCFPAKEMAEACAAAIKKDPAITHCSDPNCIMCNDIVSGGPIWDQAR